MKGIVLNKHKYNVSYLSPRRILSRTKPTILIFIFAVLLLFIGTAAESLHVLVWIGLIVVIIYVLITALWLYDKLK